MKFLLPEYMKERVSIKKPCSRRGRESKNNYHSKLYTTSREQQDSLCGNKVTKNYTVLNVPYTP